MTAMVRAAVTAVRVEEPPQHPHVKQDPPWGWRGSRLTPAAKARPGAPGRFSAHCPRRWNLRHAGIQQPPPSGAKTATATQGAAPPSPSRSCRRSRQPRIAVSDHTASPSATARDQRNRRDPKPWAIARPAVATTPGRGSGTRTSSAPTRVAICEPAVSGHVSAPPYSQVCARTGPSARAGCGPVPDMAVGVGENFSPNSRPQWVWPRRLVAGTAPPPGTVERTSRTRRLRACGCRGNCCDKFAAPVPSSAPGRPWFGGQRLQP